MRCHDSLAKQINNVLCFFRKLDPMIKLRLRVSYCYSLYGSVLWDALLAYIEQLCRTWRVAIRRVWVSPYNTHNLLLPLICCRLPLYDELMKRFLVFVQKCLTCDSELVTSVSRYAVWYGRMLSPVGRNVLHCSLRYGFVVHTGSELNCQVIRNFYWQSVSRDDVDKARILLGVIICSSGELSFV